MMVVTLAADVGAETATLVDSVDTDQFSPVAIDPAGIAYLPNRDRLLVVDSEIDETNLFEGVNLWEINRTLQVTRTGLTPDPAGRIEPNGLAYDPVGRRLFISNDQTDSIFIVGTGPDGRFGTGDDVSHEYSTVDLGSLDPADVAYSSREGRLFVLDFATRLVHRIDPGSNKEFDGLPPTGDDEVMSFSLAEHAIFDAEGLGYRAASNTLLVTNSGSDAAIYELTTSGALVRAIDISFMRISGTPFRPADIEVAPPSNGAGESMYITDRGADSGVPGTSAPGPLDGRVLEVQSPLENLPPRVSAGPDRSLTLSQSAVLKGSAIDDGQPSPDALEIRWVLVEGPSTPSFGSPRSAETVASFNHTGSYVLELRATDGVFTASDRVNVEVTGSSSGRFLDDDDSIFEADIEWLAERGITRGCNPPVNNLFCPKDPVTRGQMSAFLNRALDLPPGSEDSFVDDDDSVFEADIEALAASGITKGCNPPVNDRFCPGERLTRGQMAAFLARALALPRVDGDRFTDDESSVFEADIEALAAAGITRGCNPPANDRFCPDDPVTREQMAAFLHRALG
ncbi:MAG TPA: S-layer homology domain-containing protein [Acidimicrobiia bacterium]|nr:S-layer homology domain-containing protein [Acidimicrobiia bacterium]